MQVEISNNSKFQYKSSIKAFSNHDN